MRVSKQHIKTERIQGFERIGSVIQCPFLLVHDESTVLNESVQ